MTTETAKDAAQRKAEQRRREADRGLVRVEVIVYEGQQEAVKLLVSELVLDGQDDSVPEASRKLRESVDRVLGARRQVSAYSDLGKFSVVNSTTPQFSASADQPNAIDGLINQLTEYFGYHMETWTGAIAWHTRPSIRMINLDGKDTYHAWASFSFAPKPDADQVN